MGFNVFQPLTSPWSFATRIMGIKENPWHDPKENQHPTDNLRWSMFAGFVELQYLVGHSWSSIENPTEIFQQRCPLPMTATSATNTINSLAHGSKRSGRWMHVKLEKHWNKSIYSKWLQSNSLPKKNTRFPDSTVWLSRCEGTLRGQAWTAPK